MTTRKPTTAPGKGVMRASWPHRATRGRQHALYTLVAAVVAALSLSLFAGTAFASGGGPGIGVNPVSGPVGTHLTVTGSKFTPGDKIQVGYTSGTCASGVTVISGATGTANSSGTISIPVTWPATGKGSFAICAQDTTNNHSYSSDSKFTVTDPSAPSITISSPVKSGGQVTVTGAHFELPNGGTVEILYGPSGSSGCASSQGTATINSDGSFTFTFNAPNETSTTTIVVTAVAPQGSCGNSPTLSATTTLQVLAAGSAQQTTPTTAPTATATTAPTATATTSTTSTGTSTPPSTTLTFPPSWPPSGPWTVVYCLIGLLLLLLLLLLALLLARGRNKNQPVTTVKQQDSVATDSQGGSPMVRSSIYAEGPGGQKQTPIAEEVTTVTEEPIDPQDPNAGNPGGRPY